MTLKSPTSVILEKAAPSLSDAMNDIRAWLDSRKIAPIEFKTAATKTGCVAVEIKFASQDEAYLFARAFGESLSPPDVGSTALSVVA